MTATLLRAPAKLTLSLHVTGIREDGFHLIDAEMVTLDFADELELDVLAPGSPSTVELHNAATGRLDTIPAGPDNLVCRALDLVGRSAHVRLTKHIPPGAGLGGGSADAAAILRWAGFTDLEAAARVGADVSFCIRGGRARVTGIGEVIEPLPFVERTVTLLTPPFGCSTPAVYKAWDRLGGPTGAGPNDLETAALEVQPGLEEYRQRLRDATGEEPVLAGSGSTWFVPGAHPGEGRIVARTTPSAT